VTLFSIFGWLSIIAIVSLIIAHVIVLLIKIADEIPKYWRHFLYLVPPTSYIVIRLIFYYIPIEHTRTVSLIAMILSTIIVTFLLLKYKSDKFKTTTKMKPLKVEDGPRRDIRE
jgi:hypothetical protein